MAAAADAAQPANAPSLSFEANAVVVSGVTPRGKVILFGVSREPVGDAIGISKKTLILEDTDGDGIVRREMRIPAVVRGAYVAIDFERGTYAIGAPGGRPVQVTPLPIGAFTRKSDNQLVQLALARPYVDVLCVRAKHAAWRISLQDGAAFDRDGKTDGKLSLEPEQLTPILGGKGRFNHFKKHDLVVVIAPETLEVLITEVAE